jgi:molybdate transport system substrate-binding protein
MSLENIFGKTLPAILVICLCLPGASTFAQKKQIRVAAAADLQTVMPEIAKMFETQRGVSVEVVYGSSGNFYAQILNGAPLDVFFSADSEYPRRLEEAGFAEPRSAVVYGLGRIVLWMPANASCDPERERWRCLLNPDVKKIAIANPEHAPYGRAAIAALLQAGVYGQIKAKLVMGENISQAAQFVQSGNAQAAILAYSVVLSPALREGRNWPVPRETYPPIEQTAVVLKSAKNKSSAQDFVKFVTEGPGRDALRKFGFQQPKDQDRRP